MILLPNEVLLIESVLSPTELVGHADSPPLPTKEMCLKLGSALYEMTSRAQGTETTTPPATLEVVFTDQELWILRERLNIFAVLGDDTSIGVRLKTKIYEELRSNADKLEGPTINLVEFAKEDLDAKIKAWNDARALADTDPGPRKKRRTRPAVEPGPYMS